MRRSKSLLAFAIVLPPVLCGLGAWAAWSLLSGPGFLDDARAEPSRAEIENVARIKLPPSARGVRAHLEGFQDRIIHVRFELPPADVPAFVGSTRCEALRPDQPVTPPAGPGGADWWQPARATRREGCHGEGAHFDQTVLVDESDPARAVVYVETFEH